MATHHWVIEQIRGSFIPNLTPVKCEDVLGQVLLVPSKIDRRVSNIQELFTSIWQENSEFSIWIMKQATLGGIRVVYLEMDLSHVSELKRPVVKEMESIPGNGTRPAIGARNTEAKDGGVG